jgi:hypothetical protein
MTVTLRSTNNGFPEYLALPAVAAILPGYPTPNTYLAQTSASQTGAEQIIWDDPYALVQNTKWPAMLLTEIDQASERDSLATWVDQVIIECRYFDRWDTNGGMSIAQIWKTIITPDLYRMQSNIQANESLTQGLVAYATSIPKIILSQEMAPGGTGALDNSTIPGVSLVHRSMFLHINVLPYDSFS